MSEFGDKTSIDDGEIHHHPTKRFRSEGEPNVSISNSTKSSAEGKQHDSSPNFSFIDTKLSEIISSTVLENVKDISTLYQSNTNPYSHGFVEDIFVDGFLGKFGIQLIVFFIFYYLS